MRGRLAYSVPNLTAHMIEERWNNPKICLFAITAVFLSERADYCRHAVTAVEVHLYRASRKVSWFGRLDALSTYSERATYSSRKSCSDVRRKDPACDLPYVAYKCQRNRSSQRPGTSGFQLIIFPEVTGLPVPIFHRS